MAMPSGQFTAGTSIPCSADIPSIKNGATFVIFAQTNKNFRGTPFSATEVSPRSSISVPVLSSRRPHFRFDAFAFPVSFK
jgi:hypothetical protein